MRLKRCPAAARHAAWAASYTFLEPVPDLPIDQRLSFYSGGSFFRQAWLIAPSSTTLRDGLGPLFNARSCVGCHVGGARGRPPETPAEPMMSLTLRLSLPGVEPHAGTVPEPTYGDQLQILGIALTEKAA